MITRIFRITIEPLLREEFELKFSSISVKAVQQAKGSIAVKIAKPTKWMPDEYVMISEWDNEESLKQFAGENWNEAHIPVGMEKFIIKCSTHHYEFFEMP
jgi:heme-degrading monooxygenase HmoA